MTDVIHNLTIAIVFAPLLGCLLTGLWCRAMPTRMAHAITIGLMSLSFLLSVYVAKLVLFDGGSSNSNLYTWLISGSFQFHVGFLVDQLTALMMVTVNFVSLAVHIYSVGYMEEDKGQVRFFSYISGFTFAMLMLVTANNFFQLFFGWEGVGLVSYLLIGFWFNRPAANFGGLKAFLVNRVGDFGFILAIAAVLNYFGTLDYVPVFNQMPQFAASNPTMSIVSGTSSSVVSVISILLLIGAMGKSAQVPLHVWLPESMEGPTPISALIHAATMVTAGIFMICRMSPIFEYSATALSLVLVIGATGALFTGFLAVVQHDIKRVVAYSTLSQLGYMMAALGASAYAAGMFHLITHAAFKALLFLAAGSVIVAMHHEQDMRQMGGLRKYMPITYITFFIGALSLAAIPPFSGFFSKDGIIEAIHAATIPGADYAYLCVLLGSFVTALYIFRALFLTFHGEERMDEHVREHLHETKAVITGPLLALAVPSIILGGLMIRAMLYPTDFSLLGHSITVLPQHDVLRLTAEEFHGAWNMVLHSIGTLPFWFALSGIAVAWICYGRFTTLPVWMAKRFSWIYRVLVMKYGFDDFNQLVFVRGGRRLARWLYEVTDRELIDDTLVNGSGRAIEWLSLTLRRLQTGYLYHYAFAMILGLVVFLIWVIF